MWRIKDVAVDVSAILKPAVYVLVRDGAVVFVGSARKDVGSKIEAHRSNWGHKHLPFAPRGILFDQAYLVPCRPDQLNEIEADLIEMYKPRFNSKLKPPPLNFERRV